MSTRRHALVAGAVALAALGLSAAPAQAATPATRVNIFEGIEFEPGGPLVFDWGYDPAHVRVPSGATVRWNNPGANIDPHTVTLVPAAAVPQTVEEIFACFEGLCGQVAGKHFPEDENAEPVRALNVGRPGLNRAGDSRLLFPGQAVSAKVTAAAGRDLHYICALHPWMQAKIHVT